MHARFFTAWGMGDKALDNYPDGFSPIAIRGRARSAKSRLSLRRSGHYYRDRGAISSLLRLRRYLRAICARFDEMRDAVIVALSITPFLQLFAKLLK